MSHKAEGTQFQAILKNKIHSNFSVFIICEHTVLCVAEMFLSCTVQRLPPGCDMAFF